MDLTFTIAFFYAVLLGATLSLFIRFLLSHGSSRSKIRLPPGPPGWPIIGNLNLLGKLPHQDLGRIAAQYGPILYLRLGSLHTVVVSSPDLAKQFLTSYDKEFADRPYFEATKRVLYPDSLFFMPYGLHWRETRKICAADLFNTRSLQETMIVRLDEIDNLLRDIEKQSKKGKQELNLRLSINDCVTNITGRILMSKRASELNIHGTSLREIIHRISIIFGTPVLGDYVSQARWLDIRIQHSMDRLHEHIDEFLETILSERRQNRAENLADESKDFLDVLFSVYDNLEAGEVQNQAIKTILLDLIIASIGTASDTLEWIMAELLCNPWVLRKLQNELDSVIISKTEKLVDESQAKTLPYLNAVIKETFRLHPPTPLLVPHFSNRQCEVAGYVIPEKTRLIVNVWAIGRCHSTWESPEQFKPDRFIGKDMDIKGRHFELIPFGAGRRICPGLPLAMSMIQLTVANLVRNFDWSLPSGERHKHVNMPEEPGFTMRPATPLVAIATPRSSSCGDLNPTAACA